MVKHLDISSKERKLWLLLGLKRQEKEGQRQGPATELRPWTIIAGTEMQ